VLPIDFLYDLNTGKEPPARDTRGGLGSKTTVGATPFIAIELSRRPCFDQAAQATLGSPAPMETARP
jgi:hypothetical protein